MGPDKFNVIFATSDWINQHLVDSIGYERLSGEKTVRILDVGHTRTFWNAEDVIVGATHGEFLF